MPHFMSDKQTQNWWDKLECLNKTIKTSNPNPKKNPTIYKKKKHKYQRQPKQSIICK